MRSKQLVLLKNMLRAGGQTNLLRHEKDKKKRSKIVGNIIGMSILFLMLAAYCVLACVGFGILGMIDAIPVLCAVTIALVEFVFTLLKTNGYLFAFKEYDMHMSLPFSVEDIVSAKFLYMYVRNLPWVCIISIPMLIGYVIFAGPNVLTIILWLVLSALMPIIPMAIASALGAVIAAFGTKFKHKQMAQSVLTIIFVLFCFSLRFIINGMVRNDAVDDSLVAISKMNDAIARIYLPAAWFNEAITSHRVSSILLLISIILLIYVLFSKAVSKYYKQINSKLMAHAAGKKYSVSKLKTQSAVNAIAFKEYRRFINSTPYFTNVIIGELLVVIMCVAALFMDMDKILYAIVNGAPVTKEMIIPAVPMIVYFLIGMMSSTACSYSLEGKNLWIIDSLPINRMTLFKGKMLFNLYLQVPFTILGNVCIGLKCGASALQIILFVILGIVLCLFSTVWGMRCDIKHSKFEWENEIEVIKQGSAVAIYLLPNMFISMILVVVTILLAKLVGPIAVMFILMLVYGGLAGLIYLDINKRCK